MFPLILFSFFVLSISQECGISQPQEPQVHSLFPPLGKWPWQVYIIIKSASQTHLCGGSIISSSWILTAAHCVSNNGSLSNPNDVYVVVGVVNMSRASEINTYRAQQLEVHPNYYGSRDRFNNDIALIQLQLSIEYCPTMSPICIVGSDQEVKTGYEAWTTGFGQYTDETGNFIYAASKDLRETRISLATHEKCIKHFKLNHTNSICAGSRMHFTTQGDSGGPLMMQSSLGQWYQIGVVSFGPRNITGILENPDAEMIDGFTLVSNYCDWIKEKTKGKAQCSEQNIEMKMVPNVNEESKGSAKKVKRSTQNKKAEISNRDEDEKKEHDRCGKCKAFNNILQGINNRK